MKPILGSLIFLNPDPENIYMKRHVSIESVYSLQRYRFLLTMEWFSQYASYTFSSK
jgi:hypothetical protein